MATIFYPEIVGRPFFQSVKNELKKRKGLHQTAYTLDEGENINTVLWQPYFKMSRVTETTINGEFDYFKFNTNDLIKGKFSSLGKVSEEDIYKIEQGVDHVITKNDTQSDFKIDPGIISVNIKQDNFTFFTAIVNFVVPDISDWKAFRDMWLMWGFPVELEFGRYTNVTLNYTNGDVNPQTQRLRGIIANFNYSAGNMGRSITGEIKIYSPSHLLPLLEKSANEIQKDQFQGHVLDRIKGDRYLWGQGLRKTVVQKSKIDKQKQISSDRQKLPSNGNIISPTLPSTGDSSYSPIKIDTTDNANWKKDALFLSEVDRVAKKFDINSNDLLNVMAFESSLDPKKKNELSTATGLIQFLESTANELGTTTADIEKMSRAEQMVYVEKYFEKWKLPKGASRGRIYATIFQPANATKDPIVTISDGDSYTKNIALDINEDGKITQDEMATKLDKARKDFGIDDLNGEIINPNSNSLPPDYFIKNNKIKDFKSWDLYSDLNLPTIEKSKEDFKNDFNDTLPPRRPENWLDGDMQELVYVPINSDDAKKGKNEREKLNEVNSSKFSGADGSNTYTRENTQRIPNDGVYTVVKTLDSSNGVSSITDLVPSILSYFRLNTQIFGTSWYYYISMYAIEQIVNEYLAFMSDVENSKERMIARVDVSDVEIRNLANLKINVGSVYPETVLFDPYKKSTMGKTEFKSYRDENGKLTGEYFYKNTLLKDVYISAQFLYDLTRDSSISSPYLFLEAIIKKINDSTAGLVQLQKINKCMIDTETSTQTSHIITYIDQSILVKNYDNSADEYHTFDIFNPSEKIRNVNVQTELGDDYANFVFFQNNKKLILNANSTIDQKNPNNGGGNKKEETLPPVDILQEFIKGNESPLNDWAITNMQNNEEGAHRFVTIDYFSDIATKQIESILSKGGIFQHENIAKENYTSLKKFFATLHWVYEVYLTKLHIQVITDGNSSIQLPLKYTFELDGIAGLIQGQVFKMDTEAFPMGFSIADDLNLYSFVITNIDHEFVNNEWITKIGSMLYLSQGARKKMLKPEAMSVIESALNDIEEKTFDASKHLSNVKSNIDLKDFNVPDPKSMIPKVTPADFKQFELEEQKVKKQGLLSNIKESIKKITDDINVGKVAAGIGAKMISELNGQASILQNDLDQMKLISFNYEKNIFDLGTFIQNNATEIVDTPKNLINKTQNELNGFLSPIYNNINETVNEVKQGILESTNLNEEIKVISSNLKSAMSVATLTGIVSQNENMKAIEGGLNKVGQLSNTLNSKLELASLDPKKLLDVSKVSDEMVTTISSVKNLVSNTQIPNLPLTPNGGMKAVDIELNSLLSKAEKINSTILENNRVANPLSFIYDSSMETKQLNLTTDVGIKTFKNADLSSVPDGFVNQLNSSKFVKSSGISYKKSKRLLKI